MLMNLIWSLEIPVLCHVKMFKKSNIVKYYVPLNVETYSYITKNIVFPSQSVMIIKLKVNKHNIVWIGNFSLSICTRPLSIVDIQYKYSDSLARPLQ